jgi:hypothetical protein
MSARILLVTGSRALEGSAYEAQARAMLAAYASAFAPSLVVAGDAGGPDAWAAEWAAATQGVGLRVYSLDGDVYDEHAARLRWWPVLEGTEGKSLPLQRNASMVWETAEQQRKDAVVEVFALHAAWSKTAGTLHTWSASRARGLRGTLVRFEEAER